MTQSNELERQTSNSNRASSTSRRIFLQSLAGAGAAISLGSKVAWANGEIGYWAKDLTNEQLINMLTTIQRIRWFERTGVDKMLTEPGYRGYNHFHLARYEEAEADYTRAIELETRYLAEEVGWYLVKSASVSNQECVSLNRL